MSKSTPKLVDVSEHLLADDVVDPRDLFIVDRQGNVVQYPRHSPPPDPEIQRQVDELIAKRTGKKTTAR